MISSENLRNAGMRVTSPRMKILKILEQEEHHFTADEIYQELLLQGENIGLATVYRVLMQFVEAGLAERNFFVEGKAVFEYHRRDHHDHLVCVKTGKVVEFYDEEIEARQKEIATEHGFELTNHKLIMFGYFEEETVE